MRNNILVRSKQRRQAASRLHVVCQMLVLSLPARRLWVAEINSVMEPVKAAGDYGVPVYEGVQIDACQPASWPTVE